MEKVAMISGASSGLGEAIAELFKEKGFKIIAVCRSRPKIEVECWLQADVTEKGIHKKLFDRVEKEFGRLDLLVNAAGKGNYATWEEFDDKILRDLFELNFFALINMIYTFLPLLKKSKGTIVNIASVAGKKYVPCMGPYCATKHAVHALSGSLRVEMKSYGIKVIDVSPGHIDTGFSTNSVGPRKFPYVPTFGSSPSGLALRLYKAYKRNWRSFTYPRIYIWMIAFANMFPSLYDSMSYKVWKLDKGVFKGNGQNYINPEYSEATAEATVETESD